jgi:hypothetical protein
MKETKEAMLALALIGKLVLKHAKDGIQAADALAIGTALLTEPALKAALEAGIKDADMIDDEIKAAKLAEYLQLAAEVLPALVDLLKKEDAA